MSSVWRGAALARRPDEAAAIAIIHQALDHGVRLLDTADSYSLDASDLHYGESLARKAIEAWGGLRDEVRVVTKIGMARPKGRWVPGQLGASWYQVPLLPLREQ